MKLSIPKFQFSTQNGYTLIELLVVFSVIAILSGVGVASMVSYSRSQQVNQAANSVKLVINQARANAISSVKNNISEQGAVIDCGANSLTGYSVTVIGNTAVDLFQVCSDGQSTRLKRVTLPANLEFDLSTTCTQILFNARSSSSAGLPCSLVVIGFGQTKTISVDVTGNVAIN